MKAVHFSSKGPRENAADANTVLWIASVAGRGAVCLLAFSCVIQALLAANAVAVAFVMRSAIDLAVSARSEEFVSACVALGAMLALQALLAAAGRMTSERMRVRTENALRQKVFAASVRRSKKMHSGEIMARMTSDATAAADGFASFFPSLAASFSRLIGASAGLAVLVPQLLAVFAVFGVGIVGVSFAIRPLLKRLHRNTQQAESDMRSYMHERLDALPVVRSFGRERRVIDSSRVFSETYERARLKRADVSTATSTALSLAMQAAYVAAFAWCGWGIMQTQCTYGTLVASVQLISQMRGPLSAMGSSASRYAAMVASAERVREATQAPPDNAFVHVPPCEWETIELHDATLCRDGETILAGCSFLLKPGEFVGIAGPSGAGKSTFAELLLGLSEPDSGSAFVRLASGSKASLASARGLVAYVPQGNAIMASTIRESVAFTEGAIDCVDDLRLREACRIACALDFIEASPDGFDTELGQRGAGFSVGQLQRLAVARAIYSEAPVLLLDEATSALDAETEHRMLENLRTLEDRTVVLIAHREAALAVCDRVVLLENGICEIH